jgi:FAD/FMN-containing dehydrogenase
MLVCNEEMALRRNPLFSDRQGFNRRWYAPNVEARYGTPGAVKVVSGRHCYESFVYDMTTRVIVDVSLLRGIGYDQADGFWIESVCRIGSSDFKVVRASADSPDPAVRNLFWACRGGGGGNFGAIARHYFKTLPTAPSALAIETYTFPWSTQTVDALWKWLHDYDPLLLYFKKTCA